MMQSRLAAKARTYWVFSAPHTRPLRRGLASALTHRTADPEGIDANEAAKAATSQLQTEPKPNKEIEPLMTPKPPCVSSPKLESIGVNQRLDPSTQQKRSTHIGANTCTAAYEDVSCVGLDGTPLPREKEEDDYKAYFMHHKASPLSEIELVDTRKPITQATDGTAGDFEVVDVIGWRPEQLDTAEVALRRATEIWKQNAMRGDPDSPQSRVLRALRGE